MIFKLLHSVPAALWIGLALGVALGALLLHTIWALPSKEERDRRGFEVLRERDEQQ